MPKRQNNRERAACRTEGHVVGEDQTRIGVSKVLLHLCEPCGAAVWTSSMWVCVCTVFPLGLFDFEGKAVPWQGQRREASPGAWPQIMAWMLLSGFMSGLGLE